MTSYLEGEEWAKFLRDFKAGASISTAAPTAQTVRERKIQALIDRGATAGERAAAQAAMDRLHTASAPQHVRTASASRLRSMG